ncbi:hypothetical protein ADL06_05600 [Streptomyces sp. NRRL F-6491]|nr:hypothetical protein ADL06_05600 [Streptomyces sp. NRRL F-6491]KOX51022.1 hypothetical protein ADL08_04880 [Streptomyces sp. NRRL F-6492]
MGFDWTVKPTRIRSAEWAEVEFGTSRAGASLVPLYRTADVNALPRAHPEADWEELRRVGRSRPSPLAALLPKTEAKVASM